MSHARRSRLQRSDLSHPRRCPVSADRAIEADRAWASRLGFDAKHRDPASLRKTYTVIYRVGSSMAHPSLAGISVTTARTSARITVDLEPPERANEALQPVPMLLLTALAVSAHVLGAPEMAQLNDFLDWIAETAPR